MGAWKFVDRRIEKVLAGLDGAANRPRYVGPRGGGEPGDRVPAEPMRRSRRALVDPHALRQERSWRPTSRCPPWARA